MIQPTHRGLVTRFGDYKRFQKSGITFIIPFVEKLRTVNITEQMTEVDTQMVITKDNLNAKADLQIYFKIKDDEVSVKASQYNVYNVSQQIVALASTGMRDIIGGKNFTEVNSGRKDLNKELMNILSENTKNWGVEIVRAEMKRIEPPESVQDTMNGIIEANNLKIASVDKAEAVKNVASGEKEAVMQKAEGDAKAIELVATATAKKIETIAKAEAERIKVVYTSSRENFTGNAVLLKTIEANAEALKNNTKIVIAEKGVVPTIVFSDSDTNSKLLPLKPQEPKGSSIAE